MKAYGAKLDRDDKRTAHARGKAKRRALKKKARRVEPNGGDTR